ncbi:hypothetical protein [Mesorhizobium onobrychidis]|nr:hypothetical protein [Mesorhizobium onobrychidis]
MSKDHAGVWTRTSRVIEVRPEDPYAAFTDPDRARRLAAAG